MYFINVELRVQPFTGSILFYDYIATRLAHFFKTGILVSLIWLTEMIV